MPQKVEHRAAERQFRCAYGVQRDRLPAAGNLSCLCRKRRERWKGRLAQRNLYFKHGRKGFRNQRQSAATQNIWNLPGRFHLQRDPDRLKLASKHLYSRDHDRFGRADAHQLWCSRNGSRLTAFAASVHAITGGPDE